MPAESATTEEHHQTPRQGQSAHTAAHKERTERPPRVIGAFPANPNQSKPGPALIVTAALHGNEPAGVAAAKAVLTKLNKHANPNRFRGSVTFIIGNTRALQRRVRFIHEDLNRHFTPTNIERAPELQKRAAKDPHAPLLAEDRELIELRTAITRAVSRKNPPGAPRKAPAPASALLDLHTTSSETHPFLFTEDQTRCRKIAARLPVITCLGGEPHLKGLLADWFNETLGPAFIFEAAKHNHKHAPARHEAAIWLLLHALRMLHTGHARNNARAAHKLLKAIDEHDPHVLEIRHRHPVKEGDRFAMKPGFANFQPVRKGDHLANDKKGFIHAPRSGRIFMPLYQPQGEDGFFIANRMSTPFLAASSIARALALHRVATLLPGVSRVHPPPAAPPINAFSVSPRIARLARRQVFALLGYRRTAHHKGAIIFARTPTDLHRAAR